jgi:GNAT superfamily N-acetyltransferase
MAGDPKLCYTGEELLHAVYSYWASNFGCDLDLFDTPGTTIVSRDSLRGEGMIYSYQMKRRSVLRVDPVLVPRIEQLVAELGPSTALAPDDFRAFFGEARVDVEDIYPHFYLDPTGFTPVPEREEVRFRRLAQSEYSRLDAFFGACSEQDLENADIWLDEPDPVVFCGFLGDQMVAYGSHRYLAAYGSDRRFGDVIADVGVLVHPEFRGMGLGKAVISALSQWCIDHDKIPQYQTNQGHVRSRRIPESLGYTRLFDVIPIEVS